MQLFALVSPVNASVFLQKRKRVQVFLSTRVVPHLSREYLALFDDYYYLTQERRKSKKTRELKSAPDAIKIIHLCSSINTELKQAQKISLLVHLISYMKAGEDSLSDLQHELLQVVSEVLFIEEADLNMILNFITDDLDKIPEQNLIYVYDDTTNSNDKEIFIQRENFIGKLIFLYIDSVSIFYVKYNGENDYFLNGLELESLSVYLFNTGASIRSNNILPLYYSDVLFALTRSRNSEQIVMQVTDLWYYFKNGKTGLKNINFNVHSGRVIGIMGLSGSGKTTLLNVLNGINKPQKGSVKINGIDVHNSEDRLNGLIGYVSQDDLLMEDLTVFQNLYFNSKFSFGDKSKDEHTALVNTILKSLGLFEIRDMKVGSTLNKEISGGQRKRLNIALELIREPSVLFLDEPTSGLSSIDSENIMDLLADLAFKGKLIMLVIHQPSSDIYKMLSQLILLDNGGELIYDGDPLDAIDYFKSRAHKTDLTETECYQCGHVNSEQIFNIIETHQVDDYGNSTNLRRINTVEWVGYHNIFKKTYNYIEDSKQPLSTGTINMPNKFKQLLVYINRDVLTKLSNQQYILVNLLEVPVLSFILAFLLRYYNSTNPESVYIFAENTNLPVYIFMSVVVAIFIGMSISADEIIKDRAILKREHFLNLSWNSYLLSKVLILTVISAIQAFLFVIIGNTILEIRGMYFQYWIVLFSAWVASNIFGLVISDSFKTAVNIYILIPFMVIPQIILSGIIVKYDKLNPNITSPIDIPLYGEMIVSRWAFEALSVEQFMNNKYEKHFYPVNKLISSIEFRKNYLLPILLDKTDICRKIFADTERVEQFENNITLLSNEINKENNSTFHKDIKFYNLKNRNTSTITQETIDSIYQYFTTLKKYYVKMFSKSILMKDEVIREIINADSTSKSYANWINKYHNENLKKFVRNSDDKYRIIEYELELHQKIDPIYLEPKSNMIKAHFFAPTKRLFGYKLPTLWVNVIVIWLFSIVTYSILYFRVLYRIIEFFKNRVTKIKDNKD